MPDAAHLASREHRGGEYHALKTGIELCGDRCDFTESYEESDVVVYTGGVKTAAYVNHPNSRFIEKLLAVHKGHHLIIESPAFRRNYRDTFPDYYVRLSWDGFLRGSSDYANTGSPPDRWLRIQREHSIELKDFDADRDGYVLILMQKWTDSSLAGLDIDAWVRRQVNKIREHTDRRILVRAHPSEKRKTPGFSGTERCIADRKLGLYESLAGARCVFAYTSLSTIEAACEGIPVFTSDKSASWPVSQRGFECIERPVEPGGRDQWLADLAYGQWRKSEIQTGEPWKRLRRSRYG